MLRFRSPAHLGLAGSYAVQISVEPIAVGQTRAVGFALTFLFYQRLACLARQS